MVSCNIASVFRLSIWCEPNHLCCERIEQNASGSRKPGPRRRVPSEPRLTSTHRHNQKLRTCHSWLVEGGVDGWVAHHLYKSTSLLVSNNINGTHSPASLRTPRDDRGCCALSHVPELCARSEAEGFEGNSSPPRTTQGFPDRKPPTIPERPLLQQVLRMAERIR